ncbi:MAG: pyridoxal-phosphate dependent enzyme [Longimicrobiales bacterium]|nr:pyridoxal-phosphate dependent enzyme [Longimicrobiales bacterium]
MGPVLVNSGGLVTLPEIDAAAKRIEGVALRTPLLPFPELSELLGSEVRLKCESLQRGGSFKIRGALNFVSQLSHDELTRGVITYSSGNHGQALALAARLKGIRAVVVMPTTAPAVKVEGAKRLGAEVVFEGTTSLHRKIRAEAIADTEGLVVVPPFDHPLIIAGQGTVGREIAEDWPEVEVTLVPIGGGGLASGIAVALKALLPTAQVVGVEPKGAASMRAALDSGGPVTLDRIDTIADGIASVRAGDLTFLHARALFHDVVLVEDEAIRQAAALLLSRRKLVVEFSGAASLGALLSGVFDTRGRNVAVVLSGGNLDPSEMERLAGSPS